MAALEVVSSLESANVLNGSQLSIPTAAQKGGHSHFAFPGGNSSPSVLLADDPRLVSAGSGLPSPWACQCSSREWVVSCASCSLG